MSFSPDITCLYVAKFLSYEKKTKKEKALLHVGNRKSMTIKTREFDI